MKHHNYYQFMNLIPEFLCWIDRGVLLCNLETKLVLAQPSTLTPVEQILHPGFLYQGKNISSLRSEGEKEHFWREKRKQQIWDKSTYLPSDCGGIERRKFQRILIVFSCGPDGATLRTAERGDDEVCKLNKKLMPWHKILDFQTPDSSAHILSKRGFRRHKIRVPFWW